VNSGGDAGPAASPDKPAILQDGTPEHPYLIAGPEDFIGSAVTLIRRSDGLRGFSEFKEAGGRRRENSLYDKEGKPLAPYYS
jgi:hypothetical protein